MLWQTTSNLSEAESAQVTKKTEENRSLDFEDNLKMSIALWKPFLALLLLFSVVEFPNMT